MLQIPRYILTLHELLAHTPHEHVERNSLDYAKSKLEELSRSALPGSAPVSPRCWGALGRGLWGWAGGGNGVGAPCPGGTRDSVPGAFSRLRNEVVAAIFCAKPTGPQS